MGVESAVAELGVLIYPGAQMAAVHGLTDLFGVANRIAAEHQAAQLPLLRVSHWRADAFEAPVRVFDSHPGPDQALMAVLIPPSIAGFSAGQAPSALIHWIRQQHASGATLGGVCVGSILMAESGLLNGRSATTHWTSAKQFAERYPAVKLNADKPIVDDGDLITTAGLMAWAELGLRLVDRLLGPSIATSTARFLVVEHSDSASQCGSNFAPILGHGDPAILKVQHWLQGNGAVEVSLTAMAQQAGLEERTFLRRFRTATGRNPPNTVSTCESARPGRCLSSPTLPSTILPGPSATRTRALFARPSRRSPVLPPAITGPASASVRQRWRRGWNRAETHIVQNALPTTAVVQNKTGQMPLVVHQAADPGGRVVTCLLGLIPALIREYSLRALSKGDA